MAGLAEEQAALRRVATLVAQQASQTEVFAAIAAELGRVLGLRDVRMVRFETGPGAGAVAVVVAAWGGPADVLTTGERLPLGGDNVTTRVFRTGGPARIDDYATASGAISERVVTAGTTAAVATPIVVAGRLWGAIIAAGSGAALPPDTEARLGQFTELMGTAIGNIEARAEVARLADEQAALRRVATAVAEGAPFDELLATIAEEVTHLIGFYVESGIYRYEWDDTATLVAVHGRQTSDGVHLGQRLPVDGSGIAARVRRHGRPARVDDYAAASGVIADHARRHGIRAALGCPIVVRGRLWGALVVTRFDADPFSAEIERRIAQFTELVAIAIANAEAQAEVQRLAEQQAALRRVATLVARGAAPDAVFAAVIAEVGRLLGAAQVGLARYEGDREISVVAMQGADPALLRVGMRLPLDGDSVSARVLHTGRSARLDGYELGSTIAHVLGRHEVNASLGAPIFVDGALWGMIGASWKGLDRPPDDAEERLAEFAQLVDTAVANADSRDQLTASRARVLSAGDDARRRVVRDLHDGAQQRLVHTIITLKLARRALRENPAEAESLLAEALDHAEQGNAELRELAHGILPSVLTRGGLRAGVDTVVSRVDLPVRVDVTDTRLPPDVEASAYFVVAEALTNAVKHARATAVEVTARLEEGTFRVEIRDDGVGGADPGGRGLTGLADRLAALRGRLRIVSPAGGGTVVTAEFPLAR
jgi:signal transduction histidine kinase